GDLVAHARDHDLGAGPQAEQLLPELFLGRLDFIQQSLELGELANQLQDDGSVGRGRRLDPDRHARMLACIVKSIDIRLAPAQDFMSARSINTEQYPR